MKTRDQIAVLVQKLRADTPGVPEDLLFATVYLQGAVDALREEVTRER